MIWKIYGICLTVVALFFVVKRFAFQHGQQYPAVSNWWQARAEILGSIPTKPGQVIFAGDSHVEYSPFGEVFRKSVNKGIAYESCFQLLKRMPAILNDSPSAMVIWTGLNDIIQGRRDLQDSYKKLFEQCQGNNLYLMEILPVNRKFPGSDTINRSVDSINLFLKKKQAVYGFTLIQVFDALPDSATWDGCHLNQQGYQVVRQKIAKVLP